MLYSYWVVNCSLTVYFIILKGQNVVFLYYNVLVGDSSRLNQFQVLCLLFRIYAIINCTHPLQISFIFPSQY